MTVFKFTVQGTLSGGEIWNCGYHFQTPDFPALHASDALVVAGVFIDSLWNGAAGGSPGIKQYCSHTTGLAGVTVYVLDPTSGRAVDKATATNVSPGTLAGAALPNQVALCVSHHTATPGRIGRGRSYLPGPAANSLDANTNLNPVVRDGYAQSVGRSLLLMQTSGYTPVLFTKAKPNRAITSVSAGIILDTQRRRRNKLVEGPEATVPATGAVSFSVLLP
jgi:hypothetical protein